MWLTKEQIWGIREGQYNVEFDDGIVVMTQQQIILTWYYWELYRQWNVPINSKHTAVIDYYTAKSHRKIGEMIWFIYNQIPDPHETLIWEMSEVFYDIHNQIYNITCDEISEYVTSGSLVDFMEIMRHPLIQETQAAFHATMAKEGVSEIEISQAIKTCYNATDEVCFKDPTILPENAIKKLCQCGLLSPGQMYQMVGPRGRVHDVTGKVFISPIETGFLEGMRTIYDSAIESRSAARAKLMNQVPLQESEYFNRGIQLSASVTTEVVKPRSTCVGYNTLTWLVTPEDYTFLRGKYYMEGDMPVLIWKDFSNIVGKVIHIRSFMGCGNENPQHTCATCLGWVTTIIPPTTNVGIHLAIPLNEKVTSDMLSTKHHDGTSTTKVLELDSDMGRYIKYHEGKTKELYFTDEVCSKKTSIKIQNDYVKHLPQIFHTGIDELNPSAVSNIFELTMGFVDESGLYTSDPSMLFLNVAGSGVYFTKQFLKYIKQHKWGSDKGYIEISLNGWNPNVPVFGVPQKGDDVWTFFNILKTYITAEGPHGAKITDHHTISSAMGEFVSILRSRFKPGKSDFNMVQCEAVLRGLMVKSQRTEDYDLPTASSTFQFLGMKRVNGVRSLSGMLLWQGQFDSMVKPHWQRTDKKTEFLLDDLFLLR
jgi:hypothetical protein